MNKFSKIAVALIGGLLITSSAMAAEVEHKVDSVQKIGSLPMQMIQSGEKVFFMTENGRFVISGELHDMWDDKRVIANTDELVRASNHVDFKKINLKIEDLLHVDYGHGPKKVQVFVAPGCPHCHDLMKQMKGLEDEYTFQMLPLPILGEKSKDACTRLAANYLTNPEESAKALMEDEFSGLEVKGGIDKNPLLRSLVTAQMLEIQSIPVIVTDLGRKIVGVPQGKSLAQILKEN